MLNCDMGQKVTDLSVIKNNNTIQRKYNGHKNKPDFIYSYNQY